MVSRKELYENARRKQAGIDTKDLANMDENLKATNESLNKSKGAKSIDEYTDPAKREQREKDLREQNERANKKLIILISLILKNKWKKKRMISV